MIIDCFCFFNELDLLEIRLNELNDVVDYFILVESTKTQTLLDKSLYFEENRKRYEKFSHKIVQVIVDKFPSLEFGTWQMENYQRNCIIQGIKLLLENGFIEKSDIILLSDLDEIPNKELLKNLNFENQISFKMSYNPFYVNLTTENKTWIGTTAIKLSEAIKNNYTPQDLRNRKDHVNIIENGGIHFGYQGGKEKVYKKFYSCIEPMDKSLLSSFDDFSKQFDEKIKDGGSFLFSDKKDDSIKLIKYDENNLPKYLIDNKEKFMHLFYE